MFAKHKLVSLSLIAALASLVAACDATAQCANCGVPTVAYYQPAAYQTYYQPAAYQTYYQPVAYQTYRPVYTGWYPGYWWDRARTNFWGTPVTTTAYYQPAYTARYATTAYYAPTYATSYAPACSSCGGCSTCGTCSTCSASYAPACSTCGTCSTCAMPSTVQEVVMRPVCDTCSSCSSCSGCSTCSDCAATSAPVSQAVYQESSGCANCAPSASAPPSTPPASTYRNEPQPALTPTENPPAERSYRESQKPEPAAGPSGLQPEPEAMKPQDSATNLEAPRLFNPNDRAAQREAAPVWTAVYHKSASIDKTPVHSATWEQAQQDAAGWTSASK